MDIHQGFEMKHKIYVIFMFRHSEGLLSWKYTERDNVNFLFSQLTIATFVSVFVVRIALKVVRSKKEKQSFMK